MEFVLQYLFIGFKFLYFTPEKLCNALKDCNQHNMLKKFLTTLYKKGELSRVAIDEAHCITTWGLDFRFLFSKIKFWSFINFDFN
jgi:bloom syndrome protein